jgi:GntR family transcriptional regulator
MPKNPSHTPNTTTTATKATAAKASTAKTSGAKTSGGRRKSTTSAATVADALREQIAAHELAPGDWMPSEHELIDAYGVSRYNAREALRALAAEGLIVTKHGSGSRVRARDDRAQYTDRRGLHQDTDGGPVRDAENEQWSPVEDPVTYRTSADVDLALALGVPEHTPVFVCDRLLTTQAEGTGRRGGAPTHTRRMVHRLYVPITVCTQVPALADDPFCPPDDLYAALADAGYELRWSETVRASMPAPDDTTTLHLPPGAAVLTTRRTTTDHTGRVLAVEDTRRNTDATQLAYTLIPTTPPAAMISTPALP